MTTALVPPIIGVTAVTFGGQVIVGGCISFTTTLKLHVAFGGTPFEAVQVTVVVPTLKVAGDVTTAMVSDLIQVTVGAGMPVAVTVNETDAEQVLGAAFTIIGLAGQVMVGATPTWIITSALEDGHGGLEIVHRSVMTPLPVR